MWGISPGGQLVIRPLMNRIAFRRIDPFLVTKKVLMIPRGEGGDNRYNWK